MAMETTNDSWTGSWFLSVLSHCAVGLSWFCVCCFSADREQPKFADFPPNKGTYNVLIGRCIDGDTVEFYHLVKDTARLDGIDAPEIYGATKQRGEKSRDELQQKLGFHQVRRADMRGRDSFKRVLIEFHRTEKASSINREMVDEGHAKRWEREK